MKNPFLEDRKIFSKVQKPAMTTKKSNQQKQLNYGTNVISDANKYQQKSPYTSNLNSLSNNELSGGGGLGYQKDQPEYSYNNNKASFINNNSNNTNNNNRFMGSEKITFGDPVSSENYNNHPQRTSGYFNMGNSLGSNNLNNNNLPSFKAAIESNSYQYDKQLKYQPRKNNFFESKGNENFGNIKNNNIDTKPKSFQNKESSNYGGYYGKIVQPNKLQYQFSPPPINNFTNSSNALEQNRFESFKPNSYEYSNKNTKQNYNQGSELGYNKKETYNYNYSNKQDIQANFNNNLKNKNNYQDFQQYKYKSPPKQQSSPTSGFNYKNDHSCKFRQNIAAGQLSPIGQVSRHKINEDSIMNLDGLINGDDLDKLLAESKTQEQLIRILGMDASNNKRFNNQQHANKKYNNEPKVSPYTVNASKQYSHENTKQPYHYANEDRQKQTNRFAKKPQYSQQIHSQYKTSNYAKFQQHQHQQEQQPMVFNYEDSYVKNQQNKIQNNFKQINKETTRQKVQHFTINNQNKRDSANDFFSSDSYQPQNQKNKFECERYEHKSKVQVQRFGQKSKFESQRYEDMQKSKQKQKQTKNSNQTVQDDLEKLFQRQVQKFVNQRQGLNKTKNKDKRVFMTTNQKIISKKYQLSSL